MAAKGRAKNARARRVSAASRSPRRRATPQRSAGNRSARSKPGAKHRTGEARKNNFNYPIVAVGGSAGGFEAAMELLKNLPPKDNNMALVIVQHLDPHHASNLAKLLAKATQMPVIEISKRIEPAPNAVYVLPANKGLMYKNGALVLTTREKAQPTLVIDRFFESLADGAGQ